MEFRWKKSKYLGQHNPRETGIDCGSIEWRCRSRLVSLLQGRCESFENCWGKIP